ncbi:serine/threonine protein kinase [Streptomyces sp. NBC_00433]
MRTVIIQLPATAGERRRAGRPELLELGPGQEVRFGRGGGGTRVEVVLPDPAVSRLAGSIRAVDDHWSISNLSAGTTYVVENPEGGGEFLKVAPRRLHAPVPFEFARVLLPTVDSWVSFDVYAPEHTYGEGSAGPGGADTVSSFPLDESAKYFLVLLALCEPRLRDCASTVIPTVPEIIERLRPVAGCVGLTRAAVNFHIDYLASAKLRVKARAGPGGRAGAKADWQRAALVATAVRFNLVREEHLPLLSSPSAGAPASAPPRAGS